jgi:hypothetical protein
MANGPNPLVAQWHSTGAAGLHSTRAAHGLAGWPRAAAHDPTAQWPSGGPALVQRACATESLHSGPGPRCFGGYACLMALGRGSATVARWRLRVAAHSHARSWPSTCAAAAGHYGTARGSDDKAVRSMVSSARGGDTAVVSLNGAEDDGGLR